jgi:hypothetical protein
MKKSFVFIFAVTILVSFLFPEKYDIRKLSWGMSFDEVQQVEGLKDALYKEEDLLGIRVEINFGCDSKGLYSVSYSTREKEFAEIAREQLKKKYGEPKTDLDYSYLIKSQNILNEFPDVVTQIYETGDFSKLEKIRSTDTTVNAKKIIKAGLSKREIWEYDNTAALLLDSPDGVVLSYWSKAYHNENKTKFTALIEELKKKVKQEVKKKTDDVEKF